MSTEETIPRETPAATADTPMPDASTEAGAPKMSKNAMKKAAKMKVRSHNS